MTKRPTISAILVNYNHSAYLPKALDAALKQTVPFDEIIVIDDASTDGSVALIGERLKDIPHARMLQNPHNIGVNDTVKIGLAASACDFIFWMSADDEYSVHIVEKCHVALERFPDAAMVSGNIAVCNEQTANERVFTLPFPQIERRYTIDDIVPIARKRAFTFFGGANLIRRDAMLNVGGYLKPLEWHADWFLYLLIAYRYPFVVIPHEFVRTRQSSDQYSHACYHWKTQKPVIEAFLRILKNDYTVEYHFFREGALLPTYDIETLWLLLGDASLRHYLTPLLAWRLLTYKPLRAVGRLLPDGLRANIRRWLRV